MIQQCKPWDRLTKDDEATNTFVDGVVQNLPTVMGTAVLLLVLIWGSASSATELDPLMDCDLEVVTHSSYGGSTDTTARMTMVGMRQALDNKMSIVRQAGSAGANALEYLNSQRDDGCTIIALTPTHLFTMARGKSTVGVEDLVGLARVISDPTLVVTAKSGRLESIADLQSLGKTRPIKWGVTRLGGSEHLAIVRFSDAAGVPFEVVKVPSELHMAQSLAGGELDAIAPDSSEQRIYDDKDIYRPVAVMSENRLEAHPEILTAVEQGVSISSSTVRGFAVRASTPADSVAALRALLDAGLRHPAFAAYLQAIGLHPDESISEGEAWNTQLRETVAAIQQALPTMGAID